VYGRRGPIEMKELGIEDTTEIQDGFIESQKGL
jgi:hypothetical protein